MTLTDVDHEDEENLATVIIALMQKDSRLKRTQERKVTQNEHIQFKLFKVRELFAVLQKKSFYEICGKKGKERC